jgi:hypothetical protein
LNGVRETKIGGGGVGPPPPPPPPQPDMAAIERAIKKGGRVARNLREAHMLGFLTEVVIYMH